MILVILLCISLISGKVEYFSVCFFSKNFFLIPVVFSYALSIYLLVGGDFSVFLTNLYDKGEGLAEALACCFIHKLNLELQVTKGLINY